MLRSNRSSALRIRVRPLARFYHAASVCIALAIPPLKVEALSSEPFLSVGAAWSGLGACLVGTAIIAAAVARLRIKKAQQDCANALELAQRREQERDQARQELLRRLEEERELAKEKMQFESQLAEYEKYASLAQLALGAAHEINNPLLGILSHLELEWLESSEKQRAEIDQCIDGAKHISRTLHRLLEYARPNPLLLSKVNLSRLVGETVQFLAHQPLLRQIALENRVPFDLPPITADANQLSQILMNLLLNAAQATPPAGTISISARKMRVEEMIELEVRDNGCGIPTDILPHVFEPFFTTKRAKGTGLGLSISQSYIRSHGGDIQLQSVAGEGTTVRVTIPMRQADSSITVLDSEEVVA